MLNKSDLEICSHTVARLGIDQSEDVRTSLAWVLRNRIEKARSAVGLLPNIATACETVLREAIGHGGDGLVVAGCSGQDWGRIQAATCLVWADGIADLTGGAVACHRHDKNPVWAKRRTPTALLGAFLFFR